MANKDDSPPPGGFAPVDDDEKPTPASNPGTDLTLHQQSLMAAANETGAAVLGQRERAAIEARTFMAWKNPRTFDRSRATLLKASERFRFADNAVYAKPMGEGKTAVGLSIRFAEEFVRAWGNLDVAVNVIADSDEFAVIEGVAVDLETNNVIRQQARVPKYVERKKPRQGDEILSQRTNSRGQVTYRIRAHDDAFFMLMQNMSAKMWRTVALKHCPSDLAEELEEACERTLQQLGGKDPEQFLRGIEQAFAKQGVTREMLEAFLGKGLSALNVAEMHQLRRIATALKQSETTWAEIIADKAEKDAAVTERAAAKVPAPEGEKAKGGKGTAGLKADLVAKGTPPEAKPVGTAPVDPPPPAPAAATPAPVAAPAAPAPETDEQASARIAAARDNARIRFKMYLAKKGREEALTDEEQTDLNRIRRDFPELLSEDN